MNIYQTSIILKGDPDKLYDYFQSEIDQRDRGSIDIKKNKDSLKFDIRAKDSVALRASLNSLTKLFTVYEKLKDL